MSQDCKGGGAHIPDQNHILYPHLRNGEISTGLRKSWWDGAKYQIKSFEDLTSMRLQIDKPTRKITASVINEQVDYCTNRKRKTDIHFGEEEVRSEGEDAKEGQVKITKKNSKDFQNKEQLVILSVKDHVKCKNNTLEE
ncbi:hypothetical protein WISP_52659 [Willisornis vidua]|uniref:Uncharacterized protein n=1 Tax=Willisornis vidua TaxID=1566151 RepID=A0ABQ9DJH4_9PASS|nr:hypothetical protein WISP_52659 [Willisornis vidua]